MYLSNYLDTWEGIVQYLCVVYTVYQTEDAIGPAPQPRKDYDIPFSSSLSKGIITRWDRITRTVEVGSRCTMISPPNHLLLAWAPRSLLHPQPAHKVILHHLYVRGYFLESLLTGFKLSAQSTCPHP